MRCWSKAVLLVSFLIASMKIMSSGKPQRWTLKPDNPTRVYIGENVSLEWRYFHPSYFKLIEVVFGIWMRPGLPATKKLMTVNSSGAVEVRKKYKSLLSWEGNLTSSLAVFVLHNVQLADGKKLFGIHIEYMSHSPLINTLKLQVEAKHIPRIIYVTTPSLHRIGQAVSLNCTATSEFLVNVTWYSGQNVLARGISEAVFTLNNITAKDWGEYVCIAKNYEGEDKKSVYLKVLPESPTILNTVKKVGNANWVLRWSEVYSEGQLVTLYTVWHRAANMSNYTTAHEKDWQRENVTGFVHHKELLDDTFYMFAVTAWNKWGESLLEREQIFLVLTDFPDGTTAKMVQTATRTHTEVERSKTPSNSGVGGGSSRKTKAFPPALIIAVVTAAVCILFVVVGLGYYTQRKCNRDKENNKRHQDRRGITAYSFTSEMDLTSEVAQGTADERRSVVLPETPLGMAEFPLTAAQPAASVRNIEKNYNKPRTGECFVLTEFRPEINTTSLETTPYDLPSSLQTFGPHKECKRSNDTSPRFMSPEDYLQPVNRSYLQPGIQNTDSYRLRHGETQRLFPNRPKPKPRIKTFSKKVPKRLVTDNLQSNPLYEKERLEHCASAKPADQSNGSTSQPCHEQPIYQEERLSTTNYKNATNQNSSLRPAVSGESPYMHVHNNTNWEVPRDHLSLFERIGGGTFGQVWKGAVLDLAGTQGWSIVAVKMLKEHSTKSDLMDLLSELDLLKKLKPHPNVIQLLGCLTKDVIRCKGQSEFKPPLVILEFVPHGDLLGYLKKSRGETDDYYNLKSAEVPRKISTGQLYKFASDIARGMEFISAHQLIHRDLAARNILVGEGLRCKITDFGMARDLGKAEIYVRRSNGVVPVKWMAVESLLTQVFTTKSDVWSYGIVLYEIFTLGGNPYEEMTGEEVFKYVANGHRLRRTSAVSPELYNLMLQCWQEDPSKRPTFGLIASCTETLPYYP